MADRVLRTLFLQLESGKRRATIRHLRSPGFHCRNSCRNYGERTGCRRYKNKKELLYDKHTLKDIYPYKDTTRCFQWEKIKERLALLENIRQKPSQWCILQNYKNRNGEAPLVKNFKRDAYKRVADTLGVERYQEYRYMSSMIRSLRYVMDWMGC